MRLIEAVLGKLGHEVEDVACYGFGVFVVGCSFHKLDLLPGHFGGVLFTHGTAQHVGLAEREACEPVGYLHDLFLVEHDAKGLAQDGFEFGQFVFNGAAPPLALNKFVHHAALDWAGAVERIEGRQVFYGIGLVAAKDVAHAAGFKLEDAGGEGFMKDLLVGPRVV